jgi:ribosomal protein S6--L-glutamate ligase
VFIKAGVDEDSESDVVLGRPRIGFLLPHYSSHNKSYMPRVVRALAERGAVVDVIHPLEHAVDLSKVRVQHDIYVLRQMSRLSLSLAGVLHSQGAVIVNPYPVTVALRDRVIKSRVLQLAGVPTPATYVASTPSQLAPLLEEGPLVVKPYQESGGRQITIVRTLAELDQVELGKDSVFAQRYHPPEGRDCKIYAIGEQLFGVKKVFPRRTEEEKLGEPFTPTPEMQDIARRCGQAFEIDLYGVDIIESDGKAYVVDMDSIPGYKGVPDAPTLLASYFYDAAVHAAERGSSVEREKRGYFH